MIITSLAVRNLRCLRSLDLQLDPLTALLGRNGSGKSSILHALQLFYDISAPVSEEDFFDRDTEHPIQLTVTFGNLSPKELEEFKAYVSVGTLTVTKRISISDGAITQKYFAATPQLPRFAEIRAISGARDRIAQWNALVESGEIAGLDRARSAADVENSMLAFEAAHPDALIPVEREEQFFGPPNIGGGKLDTYTKFLLIPAVKDVADELAQKRGASLYQLLDLIVLRKIEARDDIAKSRAKIQQLAQDLYKQENLPELRQLGDEISSLLGKFSPGARLKLNWGEPPLPELPLPVAEPKLIEDEFEGDIDKKGHGLQRALLITLLQYLAQLRPVPDQQGTPDFEGQVPDQAAGSTPALILAIEEPELYLHPTRARYLAALFTELAKPTHDAGTFANQVIYSSHSPFFVDLSTFETIRIIRKQCLEGRMTAESYACSIPVNTAISELIRIAALEPGEVTVSTFRAHLIPAMNYAASEGFFADAVLIVEGAGDAGIFMALDAILGLEWQRKGISIVPIEGKTKLDMPTIVFRGLGLPAYVLFDGDKNHAGTKREADTIRVNHRLMRLVNAAETDFPPTQVEAEWAAFETNIETEIQQALGAEVFNSLSTSIASEFGFDRSSQLLKRHHCATAFTFLAYREGHRLPVLEDVARAVSTLVP